MSNLARSGTWQIGMMIVLITHLALVLLATLNIGPLGTQAARVSFFLVCLAGVSQASIREWSLLGLALLLITILIAAGQGTGPLNRALDLAAFFSAFIVLLTLIKTAAERSPSVEQVGLYLTSQPQGRRFFATAFGSHVLGIFLNFAAISLMSPLIQRSAKQPDGTTNRQLERRQLSAMIRGFSWVIMWAPTTLTMAVIPSLFPQARWIDLLPYGLTAASIMVITGWLVDRMEWRQVVASQKIELPAFPISAFVILSTICISFILLTGIVRYLTGLSVAKSLMFAAPVMTLAWFAGLKGAPAGRVETNGLTLFLPAFLLATPSFVASATTLGLSGLLGILAGEAIPVETLGIWLDISTIPAWLILAALPVLITLGGRPRSVLSSWWCFLASFCHRFRFCRPSRFISCSR